MTRQTNAHQKGHDHGRRNQPHLRRKATQTLEPVEHAEDYRMDPHKYGMECHTGGYRVSFQ